MIEAGHGCSPLARRGGRVAGKSVSAHRSPAIPVGRDGNGAGARRGATCGNGRLDRYEAREPGVTLGAVLECRGNADSKDRRVDGEFRPIFAVPAHHGRLHVLRLATAAQGHAGHH
ncbi:hypothetical protein MPS_0055 [Mycobacterium pseudoshottsii JCM 15466]|nr:hypothetical protein MPS_0055 [Mycobacterium pseudoshottsii JCM 15466]